MEMIYLGCAALGGTILVIQFIMTVLGLGGDEGDFDLHVETDLPDDVDFSDDSAHHAAGHGSTWIFAVVSFKTIVAAAEITYRH